MSNNDDVIEALEAYVEGRFSGPERDAFEQRLRADTDLLEQLARYRDTRKAIIQYNKDERVRMLLKHTEVRRVSGHNAWWIWAAAAVAVIIGFGAWWYLDRTPSLPALAEEFDVKESPLPVFMSAEGDPHVIMDEAMQAYGTGDYTTAISRLQELPPFGYRAVLHRDGTSAFRQGRFGIVPCGGGSVQFGLS